MNANRNYGSDTEDRDVVTTVRLSRAQHQALHALAAREHRSVSGELRVAVDRHLATQTEGDPS